MAKTLADLKSVTVKDLKLAALPNSDFHVELMLTQPPGVCYHNFNIPIINFYVYLKLVVDGKTYLDGYLQF